MELESKDVAWYLISVYLGTAFLSGYYYLLDLLLGTRLANSHLTNLLNYWTYFVMTKTWLIAIGILLYVVIFAKQNKSRMPQLSFIAVIALLMTVAFFQRDLSLAMKANFYKSYIAYLLTGCSLVFLHYKRIKAAD